MMGGQSSPQGEKRRQAQSPLGGILVILITAILSVVLLALLLSTLLIAI